MPNKGIDDLNKDKTFGQVIIGAAASALVYGIVALGKKIITGDGNDESNSEFEKLKKDVDDYNNKSAIHRFFHKIDTK